MVERNAGLPSERRIDFRVGIHLRGTREAGIRFGRHRRFLMAQSVGQIERSHRNLLKLQCPLGHRRPMRKTTAVVQLIMATVALLIF
jgi:hypothetical protein